MAKEGAIYVLLAVAFLLFLSLPPSPNHAPTRRRHNRRLAHLPHVAFDPLLAELELRVEERGLLDVESFKRELEEMRDRSKVADGGNAVINIEDYFGQNGRLNLTERLAYLFPMLDRFPHDGGISHHELEVWFQRQAVDRLVHRTQRQLAQRDSDGDGELTLQELVTHGPDEEHGPTSSLFLAYKIYLPFFYICKLDPRALTNRVGHERSGEFCVMERAIFQGRFRRQWIAQCLRVQRVF